MAQRTATCVDCDVLFVVPGARGAKPKRCGSCRSTFRAAYFDKYREENRERRNAYSRRWNAENAERKALNDAKWRAANPDYVERQRVANRARVAQWVAEHPEWAAELKRRRQSVRRARQAAVTVTPFRDLDVFDRDGWICGICSDPVERSRRWPDPLSPSLDHIIPISRGGPHVPENTQLAHLGCNIRKGARVLSQ